MVNIGDVMAFRDFVWLGACPVCGEQNSRFGPDQLWEFACGHCFKSLGHTVGIERVADWAVRDLIEGATYE